MVLLDEVVEVFVLAHQDVDAGIHLDAFNGRRIGAALVDGYLFGHAVKVDGALQKAPRRCPVSLGREKKVHRIAGAVNRPVNLLPLASDFDVGLIHPPA